MVQINIMNEGVKKKTQDSASTLEVLIRMSGKSMSKDPRNRKIIVEASQTDILMLIIFIVTRNGISRKIIDY